MTQIYSSNNVTKFNSTQDASTLSRRFNLFVTKIKVLLHVASFLRLESAPMLWACIPSYFMCSCAMLLEIAFYLRFVVAVLTLVPGHVFVVDICAMPIEITF